MSGRKYEIGGLVDDSFPQGAVLDALRVDGRRVKIDTDAFVAFLRPRLGWYRDVAEERPAPKEELRWVDDTIAMIGKLRARLGDIPSTVRTELVIPCLNRNRVDFAEYRQQLDSRLAEVERLLVFAERGVETGKKASPATIARDWLAADLVNKLVELGCGKIDRPQACEAIATVLDVLGIKSGDAKYLQGRIEAFERERSEKNSG